MILLKIESIPACRYPSWCLSAEARVAKPQWRCSGSDAGLRGIREARGYDYHDREEGLPPLTPDI